MEKLIVTNFLNIKHIELDLGKINILIGPQAQGKSVVAKLVYFFKNSIVEYFKFLIHDRNNFDTFLLNKFKNIFPQIYWIEQDFEITYHIYNCSLILKYKKEFKGNQFVIDGNIDISLKKRTSSKEEYNNQYLEVRNLDLALKALQNRLASMEAVSENISDIEDLKQISIDLKEIINKKNQYEDFLKKIDKIIQIKIKEPLIYRFLFIPSGRSFFSFLKENIFSLVETFQFDYFIKAFGDIYNRSDTKYEYQNRVQKNNYSPIIDVLSKRILKGKYIYDEQEIDFITSDDGRKIRLVDASSGQQEALPIIVLLSVFGLSNDDCYFFIEEPEAHLFPETQNDIVNLMSLIFNITGKRHSFFITTHSPYILTAFNTLIQAGNTYKKIIADKREDQLQELFQIVPENQMLDINDVRVYSLQNGEIESIINEEFQVIDTNVIDEISNFTGNQFDKLLDLKYFNE